MVGHYLQLVQSRTNMVPRYGVPPVQYDQPGIIQFHHRVRSGACYPAENIATPVCADRYEICTVRVVMAAESWVFVEDRGLGSIDWLSKGEDRVGRPAGSTVQER